PENGVAVTERRLSAPDSGTECTYQVVPAHAVLLGILPLQFESEFVGERPGVVPLGIKNVPCVRDIIINRSERQSFDRRETGAGRDHPPLPARRSAGLLRHADKLVVVTRLDCSHVANAKLHPIILTSNSVSLERIGRHAVILLIDVRRINILAIQGRGVLGVFQLTVGPSEGRVTYLAWQQQQRAIPILGAIEFLRTKTLYPEAQNIRQPTGLIREGAADSEGFIV